MLFRKPENTKEILKRGDSIFLALNDEVYFHKLLTGVLTIKPNDLIVVNPITEEIFTIDKDKFFNLFIKEVK